MIENILKKRWQNVNEQEFRLLEIYYLEVKKEPACCRSVIEQFFYQTKITNYQKKSQMKKTIPTSSFKLRKGISPIYVPSKHMHVTAANLTDELAQAILEMPNGASKFEYIPSDEELADSALGAGAGLPEEEYKAKTVKELKAIAEEAGLPEEEYKKLTKVPLIAYLVANIKK